MSKWKIFLVIIAILVVPVGLTFYQLGFFKFFAPKFQNIKRDVFKETRSYNEGKIQGLARYRLQYVQGSSEEKAIIKSTIIHMFADYQEDDMPYQLKLFLTEIRGY